MTKQYSITIKRVTLFLAAGLTIWMLGRPAIAQDAYQWPYDQGSKVSYNSNDIYSAWQSWKSANVTSNNAGGNGRLRVMGGVDSSSSVSEGMAYGVLFASIFDDQATFDGLWLFIKDHMDPNGLMHWWIGNPGQLKGSYAATDAEADMAQALINACIKVQQGAWSPSSLSINYCQEATNMINAMWNTEVDHPNGTNGITGNQGYELLPGDNWGNYNSDYPQGIINLSYFAPGYFEVYAKFTGNAGWYDVINRQYAVTDIVQAKSDNCSDLVPNWNQYDGDAQLVSWQPQNHKWWSYDAARFAWRVAVDQLWYGRAEATETSNELGSFFASVGLSKTGEHSMDGQLTGSGPYPFFVGNAGAAIYAANQLSGVNCGAATGSVKESPQSAYNAVLATKDNPTSYYGDAWRLFSLLTMTGNFPNFYEMANTGGVTATATAVPINTPTKTPQPTATKTPVATATKIPVATATKTPVATATKTPVATATKTSVATATKTPVATATKTPVATATKTSVATATKTPVATATKTPQPTATSIRATSTPAPTTGSSCEVHYGVVNDWGSGFQAGVAIVNTGSAPVNNWILTWVFPNGQQINSLWSATYSQSGSNVSVTAPAWASSLQSGQEVGFGFTGSYSGSNGAPAQFYLNGTLCSKPATTAVRIASYAKDPNNTAVPLAVTLGETNSTTSVISILPLLMLLMFTAGTAWYGWHKIK